MENLRNVIIEATIDTNKNTYRFSGNLGDGSVEDLLKELVDFICVQLDMNLVVYDVDESHSKQ